MKKVFLAALATMMTLTFVLVGCSGNTGNSVSGSRASSTETSSSIAQSTSSENEGTVTEKTTIHIAGLKGPTTIGMVKLMSDAEVGEAAGEYEVTMYGTADEIVPKLVSGELDAAAIPANLASVLYNTTEGAVQVAAINTLGVLYVVETGDTVHRIEDLRGRTVYSTGKGTTPEYVLNYILTQNGLVPGTDVMVEYKSEATEVAAMLAQGEDAVAVLPQPYVAAVQMQNDKVRTALDLTQEWEKVSAEGSLVTGVLVARADFIAQNGGAFGAFLDEYEASINWVKDNPAEAAPLVVQYGIVEKEPVAQKALPAINITYVAGEGMKSMLSGYLDVLYEQEPKSVGGTLPEDEFYYGA